MATIKKTAAFVSRCALPSGQAHFSRAEHKLATSVAVSFLALHRTRTLLLGRPVFRFVMPMASIAHGIAGSP